MMKYNIPWILTHKFKGRIWSMSGEEYSGLVSLDGLDLPTIDELEKADLELQAEYEATKYQLDRKPLYKKPEDYIDMLWHSMDAGEIPKSKEFFDHIKNVKDKFPKSEGK